MHFTACVQSANLQNNIIIMYTWNIIQKLTWISVEDNHNFSFNCSITQFNFVLHLTVISANHLFKLQNKYLVHNMDWQCTSN